MTLFSFHDPNIIFFCMFYYHVVQDPKPIDKIRAEIMWGLSKPNLIEYNKDINIHK